VSQWVRHRDASLTVTIGKGEPASCGTNTQLSCNGSRERNDV
jgi:hypothetical protein